MRVVRNILAASGVIGSLFASAGVKEVLLPGGARVPNDGVRVVGVRQAKLGMDY